MGAASSVLIEKTSKRAPSHLVGEIKEQILQDISVCQSKGMKDLEIQRKLQAKYNETFKTLGKEKESNSKTREKESNSIVRASAVTNVQMSRREQSKLAVKPPVPITCSILNLQREEVKRKKAMIESFSLPDGLQLHAACDLKKEDSFSDEISMEQAIFSYNSSGMQG